MRFAAKRVAFTAAQLARRKPGAAMLHTDSALLPAESEARFMQPIAVPPTVPTWQRVAAQITLDAGSENLL